MTSGAQAEELAAKHLQQRGLMLIERNYRCRFGEIDLILRDRDTLVFTEVRKRGHSGFGGAAASIDSHKQKRLILAAQHYLTTLKVAPACRFDAVLLDGQGNLEWIQNAFEA